MSKAQTPQITGLNLEEFRSKHERVCERRPTGKRHQTPKEQPIHRPQNTPASANPHEPSSRSLESQLLPAKDRTNPIRGRGSVRNAVCRLREDSRTISRRRSAKDIRRRIREAEAPSTERVPVDLAKIIRDLPIPFVRVLELQDVGGSTCHGYFQRVAAVG